MSSKEQQVVNHKFILFTEQISNILGIKAPNIIVDESQMSTKTQLAATMVGGIVMRNNDFTLDSAFALAHELRHVWQIALHEKEYFKNDYLRVGSVNVQDYNMQKAEIDANAFASIIMNAMFGVSPMFKGLSAKVKTQIENRIHEIEDDVFKRIEQLES